MNGILESAHSLFGWTSTICLAVCGAPQAYKSWKEGHSENMSWGMVLLWLTVEVFLVLYAAMDLNGPVLANGVLNTVISGLIVYYKVWPRTNQQSVLIKIKTPVVLEK